MKLLIMVLALAIATFTLGCDDVEEITEPDAPSEAPQAAPADVPVATPCTRDNPACLPASVPDDDPGLTDDEAARAIAITAQDSTLKALLTGVDYEVAGAGSWELRHKLVGATIGISLTEPLAIDRELPAIDIGVRGEEGTETYIPLPPPYYIELSQHHQIEARALSVSVDLNREKVVEILPLPFALE